VGDFTREEVAHLLRRAGFFSAPAEIDELMGEASWDGVIDRVVDPTGSPAEAPPAILQDPDAKLVDQLVAAISYWMTRMATTPTPIVERVAFFWHGILTSGGGDQNVGWIVNQVAKWRQLGLGDLEDLLQAMATDPAMLAYLDNGSNIKASPNENFARELMELFTMGNGTFTEADVIAMARAWTGHNLNYANGSYLFRPSQHDNGDKTLFGITKNWNGPEAITEIVRGSKQAVCARYLAGRIWGAFAYANPSNVLLDELSAALVAADMNVTDFLRVVFARPEFRSASTRTALVRSPVEWEVAIMRATGVELNALELAGVQPRLGQILYRPPNVSGWRQNRAWISSSAVWAKGTIATALVPALQSAGTFADLASLSVTDAVGEVLARFGVDAPAPATRTHLEAYLSGERSAGRAATASASLAAVVTLTPDFQLA